MTTITLTAMLVALTTLGCYTRPDMDLDDISCELGDGDGDAATTGDGDVDRYPGGVRPDLGCVPGELFCDCTPATPWALCDDPGAACLHDVCQPCELGTVGCGCAGIEVSDGTELWCDKYLTCDDGRCQVV